MPNTGKTSFKNSQSSNTARITQSLPVGQINLDKYMGAIKGYARKGMPKLWSQPKLN